MKRNMPIGIDDFKKLREDYYLVDKTDFIRQLIDGHSAVTLITRPRRFGKTLTMSMLDYFFSIEKKDETEHLFDGLAIDRAGTEYLARRGGSPTIFLTLRGLKQPTFAELLQNFSNTMGELYRSHAEAVSNAALDPADLDYFERVKNYKADKVDLELSLLKLCKFLQQAYGRPIILLLDEYDVPIQNSWECGYYDEGIAFMKNFLGNALKGNPYLDFAILTGVLRVGKESIFSDLNNLEVCSVLSDTYSDVFGFTYAEVEKMAHDLGHPEQLPVIKDWYDGYRFGESEIYNPWSVIYFFRKNNKPSAYWMNTSSNGILQDMLEEAGADRLQEMRTLLEGGTVWTQVDERIVYSDLRYSDSALYTLLLTTGYLTVVSEAQDDDDGYSTYELRIPNREIRSVFSSEIMKHIATGLDINEFVILRRSLFHGHIAEFEKRLQKILLRIVSTYDTANRESFYHGFMLGLVAMLAIGRRYEVKSNRESGYGRFDLALVPRDTDHPGVVMEFKVAETPEDMETRAHEALAQIEEKAYTTELKESGVENIWCYGIAFCGKQVYIARG